MEKEAFFISHINIYASIFTGIAFIYLCSPYIKLIFSVWCLLGGKSWILPSLGK